MNHKYLEHIPHLIWVPSFNCKGSCYQCYLQEGKLAIARDWNISGFRTFIKNKRIDQITISLDRDWNIREGKYLKQTIVNITSSQIYLTFSSESHCKDWLLHTDILHLIDGIFLSEIENITHLLPLKELLNSYDIQLGINTRQLKSNLNSFDIIHILVHKPKLGDPVDTLALTRYWKLEENIRRSFPNKLVPDQCMESIEAIRKGEATSCHAGIQIQTLWPDGTITGCPYNSNGLTTGNPREDITFCNLAREILQ